MLVPPQNSLVFRGFAYTALDAKAADGTPVKILSFQDTPPTGLRMMFVFSEAEWEAFKTKTSANQIVLAKQLPPPAMGG